MPVANTTGLDTERFDLKTLEDGYVILRRMTYGEFLDRREKASVMYLSGKSDRDSSDSDNYAGKMQMVNRKVVEMEFANCIVEHNLEFKDPTTEDVRPYDFKKAKDIAALDPRIGDEISKYIDQMNQFGEDDQGN